jgi:hypothetical protein
MTQWNDAEKQQCNKPIQWKFNIDYDKIKHVPWKADVYDRLVKVRQDVGYAISAKNWIAEEQAGMLKITATAPQGQEADKALVDVVRGWQNTLNAL